MTIPYTFIVIKQ